ncbi:MAG TPA: dihydroneopterin aldolase [Candidatus Paceibacterota bacterium]|jgi:dihydroneopterin aldolase|nr:dihydroneopterin aldolase [Candidatus Paceibacterota bacterium]
MAANADTVFLEGLTLKGKHGVKPEERRVEQEFLMDIRASFDAKKSAGSDRLADTIDYARFRDIAQDVVSNHSYYLIEKIASIIAERILEDERIWSVEITIRKPEVFDDCVPGVRVVRDRT